MKKLLILFALLCVAIQVMAADVSVSMASSSAQRFLASHSGKNAFNAAVPTIKWVHQEINSSRANQAVYYVVNTDRGFAVVAGDDRAQEILAYSNHPLDDMNNLPENMKFWLNNYKQQIEYLQAHPGWVVENPALKVNRTESIEPMLVAMWNQGYPYYNQCPMDGDRRGQTGCAATSLAQVFYKWQYPTQPTPEIPGYTTRTRHFELPTLPSITFDWANMLPEYNFSATETQRNAVAWLMRYIGQAEQMDYTNEGSEAWEDDILRACHLFGYVGAHVEYKAKLNFDTNGEDMLISDADWSVMLQDELAAGRPVVYCAYSYSNAYNSFYGHAFNVDGYDATTGMYSINWGWGGTGNGYFALRAFSNQGYSYNLGELMVMGIEPPAPIEAYDPVMQPADSTYITLTSFRADWTDETPAENVESYTLYVSDKPFKPAVALLDTTDWTTSNAVPAGWIQYNLSYYSTNSACYLSSSGYVQTKTYDLEGYDKVTVMIYSERYNSNNTITVATKNDTKTVNVTGNSFNWYTFVLNCESSDYVKVTASGMPDMRYMKVYAGDLTEATQLKASETGDATYRVITGITGKSYTVTGLTENGTFNYYVVANYTNGAVGNSQVEQVTLSGSAHEYPMGDVDHDGYVTIADVSVLIDYLLDNSTVICPICADLDGDGEVTIADVSELIDMLLIQ